MKSVASIKGHPIHPMLIAFPVAFLVSAFGCNLIGALFGMPAWWTTGAWLALAGIIAALVAAVPGIVDYIYTVPPNSSAKTRATWHMVVNFGAVGLFIVAWILRGSASAEPGGAVILLEAGGLVLLSSGGWMGGTLVYRNMIGVNHRYADTGKWSEAHFENNEDVLTVARTDELKANQMKLLHVGDKRIVLARTENGFAAFDDHCSHRGGSLAGGVLMCGKVHCLWHGSQFDVNTGKPCAGPAERDIGTYHVEISGNEIRLTL